MRRRSAALLLLTVLVVGHGCYTYHPAELVRIQPGEQVRVLLEEASYRHVAPGTAQESAPQLEGDFRRATDDSVALSIWIGQAYRGTPFQSARQTVSLPRDEILRFERRELSMSRTALVAAGVVGLLVYLIGQVEFSPSANPGGDDTPPPPPTGR